MIGRCALALVLATAAAPYTARAQSPRVTEIDPDGHFFRASREKMAADVRAWLARQFGR